MPAEESIPHLVDEYQKARLLVVTTAAPLLFMKLWGLTLDIPIPLINVQVKDEGKLPHILAAVLVYALVRLWIEWYQSHPLRRKRRPSRFDLAITTFLALISLSLYSTQFWNWKTYRWTDVIWLIVLIFFGASSGGIISSWIISLFFVRGKDEAMWSGLPRIPFAIRATVTLTVVFELIIAAIVSYRAMTATEPLASVWHWSFFTPLLITLIASTLSFIPSSRRSWNEGFAQQREAYRKHDAAYQVLGIDRPATHLHTPLFRAARDGNIDRVGELLSAGGNPDSQEHLGWTPLLTAVAEGHEDIVRLLLEVGANPNCANELGRTPLMFAVRYGQMAIAETLIERGANVNAIDLHGNPNPLAMAAHLGDIELVCLLLRNGADFNIVDSEGKSALQHAQDAGKGDVATLIRRAMRGLPLD